MTIRDNVEAVHRLLVEEIKITHVRAIIGFSMGAQQAFQWAVSYPEFAGRIVATSGTAKTYGHGVVRLEGQIAALTADVEFRNGEYTAPPKKGLEAFGMVWAAWLYSQEWWRRELWRNPARPGVTFEQAMNGFRTRFSADANDYILQARTWQRHDVGATPGFGGDVERALRSIKVPLLYMPSETDLYFPIGDARYEAAFIPGVTLTPIPSLWGHTAGAAATRRTLIPERDDRAFPGCTTVALQCYKRLCHDGRGAGNLASQNWLPHFLLNHTRHAILLGERHVLLPATPNRVSRRSEGLPPHSEHQHFVGTQARYPARRRVRQERTGIGGDGQRRTDRRQWQPPRLCRMAGGSGQAHHPLLRPLRRATARSLGRVEVAAVRAGGSRQRHLRDRKSIV